MDTTFPDSAGLHIFYVYHKICLVPLLCQDFSTICTPVNELQQLIFIKINTIKNIIYIYINHVCT